MSAVYYKHGESTCYSKLRNNTEVSGLPFARFLSLFPLVEEVQFLKKADAGEPFALAFREEDRYSWPLGIFLVL
jgi:hypothetical protein